MTSTNPRRSTVATTAAAFAAAAVLVAVTFAPAQTTVPTTAPSSPMAQTGGPPATQPMVNGRGEQAIVADLQASQQQLREAIGSPAALADPAKRQAAAPKAVPILKQMLGDFDDLTTLHPEQKRQVAQAQDQFLALLSLLGDAASTKQLDTLAHSANVDEAIHGQIGQVLAAWMGAGKDPAAQTKAADQLIAADKTHPENEDLTALTYTLSQGASPDVAKRLQQTINDSMDNAVASQVKDQIAGDLKLRANEGKPITIAGKQPDGTDFSTTAWKGKVVLVDFWATWCGPRREELPRVKQVYSDFHAKGLEVLGVSNDFQVEQLKTFTAKNGMPWPELLDPAAAAQQQWNPITTNFGINGIPTMFLIDKKGVLRTIDARQNMEEMIPKLLAEQG